MELRGAFRGSALLLALLTLLVDLGCTGELRPAGAPAAPDAVDPSASPGGDGLAAAQRHIAEREYRASANGQGLQAPNRRHNLRTYFGPSGIRVHDRTAAGSPELLGLSLAGLGRGEALAPLAPGEVTSEGARVEIRRPDLVEWYVNSPAGLEQGFTLQERPEGEGALALELAVEHASASLRGERVILATAAGRRLAYGKLAVVDAAGAPVAARLHVPEPDRVRLVVDDTDATYPLSIDPLLTETVVAQLESDQTNANLGVSVSGAGDVNGDGYDDVIVGADLYDAGETDEGAAFVFLGSASGIADGNPATAAAQLESDQAGAYLGGSVSGAGDVNGDGYADVIVGADLYDAGETDEGAAFVFLGSASGIADGSPATAATQLESDQQNAELGFSVSGAGDVDGDGYDDVIVGAPAYDAGQNDEGAAFVFLGSASGIADGNPVTAAAQLESGQLGVGLGTSVSGAGDVNGDGYDDVIVGVPGYDESQSDEGAAFVFLGSASGIADGNPYTAAAQLESDQANANLGVSVSGAGDVNGDGYDDVIVGADLYDAGETDEGAAFVFLGSASGIADGNPATATAQLESDQANANLGVSVSGAGDVNGDGYADVIVGARTYDAGQNNEGAAFVFLGSASGIADGSPATAATQLESDQQNADFGYSVSGVGDVNGDGYDDVIVGARNYNGFVFGQPSTLNEGAAFVFMGSASGIPDGSPATAPQLESDQQGAELGFSVSGAGDVNGDGYDDVIVGAPRYDAGQPGEGAAFVFLGSASGIAGGSPATAATQLESDQQNAELGYSVSGAGDVDGDGYADVIVGSWGYDTVFEQGTGDGAAFVFLGSAAGIADGIPATAAARLESDQSAAAMGWSVSGAGDVNGDGYDDVIIGAINYDDGIAFVFLGGAAGIADGNPATAAARLDSGAAANRFAYSVSGAGDVNGDGYDDVIVGAWGDAFVFLGSASGIADGNPTTAATHLESDWPGSYLGWSVSGAGDVNGDGYDDVIVGARGYDVINNFTITEGAAFVFLGSASGIADGNPATAATRLVGDQTNTNLGVSVSGAGDVNGDGYADVIVGADRYDTGQFDEGGAFMFLGSASGIADGNPATAAAQLAGVQANANLGVSVSGAGDVNGDGLADVIVGADLYDAGQINEGAAFVFLPEPAALLSFASGIALLGLLHRRRTANV